MERCSSVDAFRCVPISAQSTSSRDARGDGIHRRWASICERNPIWRQRNASAQTIQRWWRQWRFIEEKHAREKLLHLWGRVEHRAARSIQVWNGFHLYRRRAPVLALFKYCRCHGHLCHQTVCWCAHCWLKRLCKRQLDIAARRVQNWWRGKYHPGNWKLGQAFKMLKNGETLDSIATATRNLVTCVKQSPDWCVKRLKASIVAVTSEFIGSLPPVSLLNQLLKLLAVLGSYPTQLDDTESQFEINLDMMEALLDVLQLYRADQHTVELSAYVLIRCQYFQELQATMEEDPSSQERFSVVKDRFDRVATMLSLKRAIE